MFRILQGGNLATLSGPAWPVMRAIVVGNARVPVAHAAWIGQRSTRRSRTASHARSCGVCAAACELSSMVLNRSFYDGRRGPSRVGASGPCRGCRAGPLCWWGEPPEYSGDERENSEQRRHTDVRLPARPPAGESDSKDEDRADEGCGSNKHAQQATLEVTAEPQGRCAN